MKTIHFEEISSTNSYAKEKLGTDEFRHGTLITATRQTEGRGRRGNSFYSEGGIYMSLMLDARYPDYPFTLAAAVAVREALISLSGIVTQIKWVNDLFYKQKKVCGILTETKIGNNNVPMGFVLGIGINTGGTKIPEELSGIAGVLHLNKDNTVVSEFIANKIMFMYENNINPVSEYKKGLILNVPVKAYSNGKFLFEGIATDINEQGNLMVKTYDGEIKLLNSGEISIKF